jgi:hypothetical protein
VTNPDYSSNKLTLNKIFHEVNMWFRAKLLKLNIKKHYLQFIAVNHDDCDMQNNFSHKQLVSSKCTKFLGFNIDNKLSWKNLGKIKFVVFYNSSRQPIMSLRSLYMIYFASIHSIITYGIIFWSNSS